MPNPNADAADTAEMLRLLDASIARTRTAGRHDLAEKLAKTRQQVTTGAWHVLVAGEFKKGKSALVNGLLGVEVCGVDPVAFTAVPTLVRYGEPPTALLVPQPPDDDGPTPEPSRADIRKAAEHGRSGLADDGSRLRAVEVRLPRQLLADGLVLVDTPGLGGGFAAAAAAATMRALNLADGVIVVTDASQELTATEVEFIQQAVRACRNLLCVLTKTDLYPHWRRILDLDREHLRAAGVDAEIVAVASPLRELALDSGDPALNAESGFPVLVDRLRTRLLAPHAARSLSTAADVVRSALGQVADALATEHAALTRPEQRQATVDKAEAGAQRAKQLSSASSRWLNTINDRFADIQAAQDASLAERIRLLEAAVTERIKESDPTREWAEIVPWLYRKTNEELTDGHRKLVNSVDDVAGEIAALFDATAATVGTVTGDAGLAPGRDLRLDQLRSQSGGRLEAGMHAARGWSLSSSVVTTLLVATLHPALLIVLPITATLGSVFAVRAVRSYRSSKLEVARSEALRSAAIYLSQARMEANRAAVDLIRHARSHIRDYYLDQAAEAMSAARHDQETAARAMRVDAGTADARATAARAELDRVTALLADANRLAGSRR